MKPKVKTQAKPLLKTRKKEVWVLASEEAEVDEEWDDKIVSEAVEQFFKTRGITNLSLF
jgi:hypothetical protein